MGQEPLLASDVRFPLEVSSASQFIRDHANNESLTRSMMKGPDIWYALSVNAFKTEAVDGTDGYTILTIPSDSANMPDIKGRDAFATWEMTSCTSA